VKVLGCSARVRVRVRVLGCSARGFACSVWVGQFLLHTLDYTLLTPDYFQSYLCLPFICSLLHFHSLLWCFTEPQIPICFKPAYCKGEFEFFAAGGACFVWVGGEGEGAGLFREGIRLFCLGGGAGLFCEGVCMFCLQEYSNNKRVKKEDWVKLVLSYIASFFFFSGHGP